MRPSVLLSLIMLTLARALWLPVKPRRGAHIAMCDGVDWSGLSKRIAEVETSEVEQRVQRTIQTAANWREGKCSQRVLFTLDDWVRRLSVSDGRLQGPEGGT